MHLLKKFYETNLKLSATKTVTSNLIFTELVGLQVEIEKKMKDANHIMQRVAGSMKLKFDKYWGSFQGESKLVFLGHVLDPRWKLEFLKISFHNLRADETRVEGVVSEVKKCLLILYNEYKWVDGTLEVEHQMR